MKTIIENLKKEGKEITMAIINKRKSSRKAKFLSRVTLMKDTVQNK